MNQMVWRCQRQIHCESDVNPRDGFNDLKRFFLKPPHGRHTVEPTSRWYDIVSSYVRQSLTFEDDRLPAISGIARETQALNSFTYKAGIWIEDIRSFTWLAYDGAQLRKNYRAPC